MKAIAAIAYIFIVYSIGDYISIKTKSIVSSLFTCSLIFLIGFWIGVPNTLFEDSGLLQIGSIIIPAMMVHMGSMININQLKEQWKTFLLAVGAVFGIAILLLLIGPFIIGREASIVSAP